MGAYTDKLLAYEEAEKVLKDSLNRQSAFDVGLDTTTAWKRIEASYLTNRDIDAVVGVEDDIINSATKPARPSYIKNDEQYIVLKDKIPAINSTVNILGKDDDYSITEEIYKAYKRGSTFSKATELVNKIQKGERVTPEMVNNYFLEKQAYEETPLVTKETFSEALAEGAIATGLEAGKYVAHETAVATAESLPMTIGAAKDFVVGKAYGAAGKVAIAGLSKALPAGRYSKMLIDELKKQADRAGLFNAAYGIAEQEYANNLLNLTAIVDEKGNQLPLEVRIGASVAYGAISAGIEVGFLDYLTNKFQGTKAIKEALSGKGIKRVLENKEVENFLFKLGKIAMAGGVEEALQSTAETVINEGAKTQGFNIPNVFTGGKTREEFLKELGADALESFRKGAFGGVGLGVGFAAAGKVANSSLRVVSNRIQATAENAKIKEALEKAKDIKANIKERLLLQDISEDATDITDIHIPYNLVQGLDESARKKLFEEVPLFEESVSLAEKDGTDYVKVKPLPFLQFVGEQMANNTKHAFAYSNLINNATLSENTVNINELTQDEREAIASYVAKVSHLQNQDIVDAYSKVDNLLEKVKVYSDKQKAIVGETIKSVIETAYITDKDSFDRVVKKIDSLTVENIKTGKVERNYLLEAKKIKKKVNRLKAFKKRLAKGAGYKTIIEKEKMEKELAPVIEKLSAYGVDIMKDSADVIAANLRRDDVAKTKTVISEELEKARGAYDSIDNIIYLAQTADKTTFIHEMSHFYLELIKELATMENGSEYYQALYNDIKKQFNINGNNITREQHEQFASAYEAYLLEGKAPSKKLYRAFQIISNWFMAMYRALRRSNVKINDDIRSIFDRLHRADEVIEETHLPFEGSYSKTVYDLLDGQYKRKYKKAEEGAVIETKEKVYKEVIKDLRKRTSKASKEWAKEEAEKLLEKDRLFSLKEFLDAGKIKINKWLLTDEEKLLLENKSSWLADNGIELRVLAQEYGFPNNYTFLQKITAYKDRKAELKKLADIALLEKYGDILYDGTLEDIALDAAFNTEAINKAYIEYIAAYEKSEQTDKKTFIKQIEADALKKLLSKEYSKVNKTTLYRRSIRLSRQYGENLAKGKYEKAASLKMQQIEAMAQYRVINAIHNKYNKTIKLAQKAAKRPTQKAIKENRAFLPDDYRNVLNIILSGLSTGSLDAKAINMLTDNLLKGLYNNGIDSPEFVQLREDASSIYTVKDVVDVINLINQLIKAGRIMRGAFLANNKAYIDDVAKEMVEQIEAVAPKLKQVPYSDKLKYVGVKTGKGLKARDIRSDRIGYMIDTLPKALKKKIDSVGAVVKDAFLLLKTAQTIFEELDGGEGGLFMRYIYNPVLQASARANVAVTRRFEEYSNKIKEIYGDNYKTYLLKEYKIDETLVIEKEQALVVALNYGNVEGRERLLNQFTEQQIEKILGTLTEKDIRFINFIWRFLSENKKRAFSIWEQMKGIKPEEVESLPFEINSVEVKGGYYPLKYDKRTSKDNYTISGMELDSEYNTPNSIAFFTNNSMFISRNDAVNRNVELSLHIVMNTIANQENFIHKAIAIQDANRILMNKGVQQAIKDSVGSRAYELILTWINDVAANGQLTNDALSKIFRFIRSNFTVNALAFNIRVALLQPLGIMNAASDLGWNYVSYAIKQVIPPYLGGGGITINDIAERSVVIKDRLHNATYNRDMGDAITALREGEHKFIQLGFYSIKAMQEAIDKVVWVAAYRKAIDKGLSDNEAIIEADNITLLTQGSGNVAAQTSLTRGSLGMKTRGNELVKTMTVFDTYFVAKYNILSRRYRAYRLGEAGLVRLLSDIATLFLYETLVLYAVKAGVSALMGDEEDDEEIIKNIGLEVLAVASAPIPLLSDAVSSVIGYTPQTVQYRQAGSIGWLVNELSKENKDNIDIARSAIYAAGTVTKFAPMEMGRMLKRYKDYIDGQPEITLTH